MVYITRREGINVIFHPDTDGEQIPVRGANNSLAARIARAHSLAATFDKHQLSKLLAMLAESLRTLLKRRRRLYEPESQTEMPVETLPQIVPPQDKRFG